MIEGHLLTLEMNDHSEKEALILENELIKRHRPRHNIMLRDDKNFLYLRIDTNETFPRVSLVRKKSKDGARYFGPYPAKRIKTNTLFTARAQPDECSAKNDLNG